MSQLSPLIAVPVALFLWWFSTGAILWVVRRTENGTRTAFLALPLLPIGFWAFGASLGRDDVAAVYLGFVATLAIWGWIELAFLTGAITGPNSYHCPPDAPWWERFIRAWGTVAYHEILLVSVLILFALVSWGQPNQVAVISFAVLFVARVSAKLNLFFGVPRFNDEFLPAHLAHLPSHFRVARMNWLFPVSVTALSALVAYWIAQAGHATTAAEVTAALLIATLSALALLEHWLLVLPLPDAKLWTWMLPEPRSANATADGEGNHGI